MSFYSHDSWDATYSVFGKVWISHVMRSKQSSCLNNGEEDEVGRQQQINPLAGEQRPTYRPSSAVLSVGSSQRGHCEQIQMKYGSKSSPHAWYFWSPFGIGLKVHFLPFWIGDLTILLKWIVIEKNRKKHQNESPSHRSVTLKRVHKIPL